MLQNIDGGGFISYLAAGGQNKPLVAYCFQKLSLSPAALHVATYNNSHASQLHQKGAVIADIVDNDQPLLSIRNAQAAANLLQPNDRQLGWSKHENGID